MPCLYAKSIPKMEPTIRMLIYIHALTGGIGLITGFWALAAGKGLKVHKSVGKIFSWSLGFSAGLSLIIAVLPNHHNPFLFLIGVFTLYLIGAGNRALKLKDSKLQNVAITDKILSGGMFLFAVIMVFKGGFAYFNNQAIGLLYFFFGVIAGLLAGRDLVLFRDFAKARKMWLRTHLTRMIAALIASVTAFMVAGLSLNSLAAWIAPTVVGTGVIIYWLRRVSPKKTGPAP